MSRGSNKLAYPKAARDYWKDLRELLIYNWPDDGPPFVSAMAVVGYLFTMIDGTGEFTAIQEEIAMRLGISQSSVSRVLNEFYKMGLVERSDSDQKNRFVLNHPRSLSKLFYPMDDPDEEVSPDTAAGHPAPAPALFDDETMGEARKKPKKKGSPKLTPHWVYDPLDKTLCEEFIRMHRRTNNPTWQFGSDPRRQYDSMRILRTSGTKNVSGAVSADRIRAVIAWLERDERGLVRGACETISKLRQHFTKIEGYIRTEGKNGGGAGNQSKGELWSEGEWREPGK